MSHHRSSDQQLLLFETLTRTRQKVLSKTICAELRLKIGKKDSRCQQLKRLDQFAKANKAFELETEEGVWIACSVGKTATGFYLWDLLLRSTSQLAA